MIWFNCSSFTGAFGPRRSLIITPATMSSTQGTDSNQWKLHISSLLKPRLNLNTSTLSHTHTLQLQVLIPICALNGNRLIKLQMSKYCIICANQLSRMHAWNSRVHNLFKLCFIIMCILETLWDDSSWCTNTNWIPIFSLHVTSWAEHYTLPITVAAVCWLLVQ